MGASRNPGHVALTLVALLLPAAGFAGSDPPRDVENLDAAKQAIVRYHDSGRWHNDSEAVVHRAERWLAARSKHGSHLALVLDIDETALLNWPEEKKTDFGYVPQLWDEWEKEGKAPASPEVLELYRFAKARHVFVFFITGRSETSRAGTAKNLSDVGYAGYTELLMKPSSYHAASVIPFKSGARASIERQGYKIIENIGDQWSDLRGGHSERAFKIPNPMYFIP
jgi:acid phosphatase